MCFSNNNADVSIGIVEQTRNKMKIRNKETMLTLYEPVRWLLLPNGCVTAREKKNGIN